MMHEFKLISYKHWSPLYNPWYLGRNPQIIMHIILFIPWKSGAIERSFFWCLTNGGHKLVNFSMLNPIKREGEVLKYNLWISCFSTYLTKELCAQYTCRILQTSFLQRTLWKTSFESQIQSTLHFTTDTLNKLWLNRI